MGNLDKTSLYDLNHLKRDAAELEANIVRVRSMYMRMFKILAQKTEDDHSLKGLSDLSDHLKECLPKMAKIIEHMEQAIDHEKSFPW